MDHDIQRQLQLPGLVAEAAQGLDPLPADAVEHQHLTEHPVDNEDVADSLQRIERATLQFDLTPREAELLSEFWRSRNDEKATD